MKTQRKTIVAGNTIFISITGSAEKREQGKKRGERIRKTTAEMERLNQRYAERSLAVILNYNFKEGDLHLVLTYSGNPPAPEDARKELERFKRRLRRLYQRRGILLKWVAVTEYRHKRIHHHIICSGGIDMAEIVRVWGAGLVRPRYLDNSGDYRKLAAYLIKETSKTFRDPDAEAKKRYTCSRTIVKPLPVVEEVSAAQLLKDPVPLRGYYIDQDTLYRGINPITEKPYVEYVMISLDSEPRIRRWKHGRKKKESGQGYTKWLRDNQDRQLGLDIEEGVMKGCRGGI